MAEIRGLPPGRSGRIWVRQRLSTAQRGATLLDRKLRVLRTEQARQRERAAQAQAEWAQACVLAQRWLSRAALLAGERGIRLACATPPAELQVNRRVVMGVSCPAVERVVLAEPQAQQRIPGTAALPAAAAAYTRAVEAAAQYAAAKAAQEAVDREVTLTAQRWRAITDRWIPRLDAAKSMVEQRLEEVERDETTRLRWASARRGGRADPGPG